MSYEQAMEAAGATVLKMESFGSYQGDWIALVTYKGRKGYVQGCYGSCSGCDAFEGEFGWDEDGGCEEHRYQSEVEQASCVDCVEHKARYNKHLAEFGEGYLDDLSDYDEVHSYVSKNLEWDMDAHTMLAWVESTKEDYDRAS